MSNLHETGQFQATPTQWWVSEYQPGKWKVEVKFNNGLYWTGFPTGKGAAFDYFQAAVNLMGFKGSSLRDLADPASMDTTTPVWVTVGHETYTDKNGMQQTKAKINFVNESEHVNEYKPETLAAMDEIMVNDQMGF